MSRKELRTKFFAVLMAATVGTGLLPTTVFAVSGNQVAKDGTYTKTTHVSRTQEDDDNEDEWNEYDVTVSLEVKDGIFSNITVTPDEDFDSENQTYLNKAVSKSKGIKTLLEGQAATEETILSWDGVSGATRTSDAVKSAALELIQSAEEAKEAETPEETPEETSEETPEETPEEAPEETPEDPEQTAEYVLMNIPYAGFYAADVNNSVAVDAFSSATLNKTRSATLAGGSYHVNPDGSDITGITFPVKITGDVDLSAYTQITDESSVDIIVTNRGTTTTTTYSGKDALFESASYSYYILDEEPAYYKELSVNEDGSLSFGKVVGEAQELSGVTAELLTESKYGDYQLNLDGWEIDTNTDKVYGVIISTKEGNDYGLRHLENIWKGIELSWCTGFTDAVHSCPTSSAHYVAMMGQTIDELTYYTSNGIFVIPVEDIYVPVKFEYELAVEDAAVTAGSTEVTFTGLPDDYKAEYSVEGLDASVADGVLTFKNAEHGEYTLQVSDKKGNNTNKGNVPKTGDPSNVMGLLGMALASAGVGTAAWKKRRSETGK